MSYSNSNSAVALNSLVLSLRQEELTSTVEIRPKHHPAYNTRNIMTPSLSDMDGVVKVVVAITRR